MIENLKTLEYQEMTPVQAGSLPHVQKGEDLLAQAKTGSGKTAAFGIQGRGNPWQLRGQDQLL